LTESGRILGLDLGQVRIGLALSDALRLTAQPLGSLRRDGLRSDLGRLGGLVAEHGVVRIVVGLPLLLSGTRGAAAASALAFAEKLRGHLPAVEVDMWDERLTTAEAERMLIDADVRRSKRKLVRDTLAAVLILQNYLDATAVR
jgi:putative Holliday junction resolvase